MANNIPEIQFVNTATSDVENYVITAYQEQTGRALAKGDPVRLLLLSIASMLAQERVLMDQSAKQNLLAYATGDFLDHIGYLVDTTRLPASRAKTTMRFMLSAPRDKVVTIPAGTRATPGGDVFFSTLEDALVAIGQTSMEVAAESLTEGSGGNDFLPGTISQIVDPFPWFQSVTNLTVSEGGADRETDEPFRQRIRQAPERFSTTGPEGAYEYWSKTASQEIMDVAVYSPQPGVVKICPLLTGGEIPGQALLDEVLSACDDKKRRPLTDKVQVEPPEVIAYNIDLTYFLYKEDIPLKGHIKKQVDAAIEEYVLWQRSRIGRDINPSELVKRIENAGAKRVEVRQPAFKELLIPQIAVVKESSILYGGEENA
jgi:phage-related baseplate assembly protein